MAQDLAQEYLARAQAHPALAPAATMMALAPEAGGKSLGLGGAGLPSSELYDGTGSVLTPLS